MHYGCVRQEAGEESASCVSRRSAPGNEPFPGDAVSGAHGRDNAPGGRGMNPDDAFERIVGLLYEAALDDALWPAAATLFEEAIGASGSILAVSEGSGDDARLHFARYLYRGESHPEPVREYFDVYHAQDEGIQRVRRLPRGRLTHGPELYTEEERKTSAAFNEGLPLLGWPRVRRSTMGFGFQSAKAEYCASRAPSRARGTASTLCSGRKAGAGVDSDHTAVCSGPTDFPILRASGRLWIASVPPSPEG